MLAPLAANPPLHDLESLKCQLRYPAVGDESALVEYHKLPKNFWYSEPELVFWALFDETVSSATKCQMVEQLQSSANKKMDHSDGFITNKSRFFFSKYLPATLLDRDPCT